RGNAAEARLGRLGRERAPRQPRSRHGVVVAGGRHVVRGVRVEERGEVLDLAATRAELELAAPVERDSPLRAVVVAVEQRTEAPEARRLDVEPARREGQRLDVRDRMDR